MLSTSLSHVLPINYFKFSAKNKHKKRKKCSTITINRVIMIWWWTKAPMRCTTKPKQVRLFGPNEFFALCHKTIYYGFVYKNKDSPCLSFDILSDDLGTNRTSFPHTCFIVSGTQSDALSQNHIITMKLSNLKRTYKVICRTFWNQRLRFYSMSEIY